MTSASPGQLYWSRIEPYWLGLNEAWEDPTQFLLVLRAAPRRVQDLYAAHWCQSEVCNGGLHQFFSNSTGILAPEAVQGLANIGAADLSEIVGQAVAYFGTDYPRNRNERNRKLPETKGLSRETWDPFGSLDDRFYAWLNAEKDRLCSRSES